MPTAEEHLVKYRLNRAFLDSNGGLVNHEPRWAVIVAHYTAIHLVERLAARENLHSGSHSRRDAFLAEHPDHHIIYRAFFQLRIASESARYDSIRLFSESYSLAQIRDILIGERLAAIEKYVESDFPSK